MKKFPKDQHLRTGKYVAQGSHAAVGALLSLGKANGDQFIIDMSDPFVKEWLTGRFKKVCVQVDTDQELVDIYVEAGKAGLARALIKDAGLTEFNGVPTLTAVGIGPGDPDKIDKITGHLKLF